MVRCSTRGDLKDIENVKKEMGEWNASWIDNSEEVLYLLMKVLWWNT